MATATKVLQVHVRSAPFDESEHSADLFVYGRNGQRCQRCGDTIEVRRQGEQGRLLYWCPGCQVRARRRQLPPTLEERPMDPHPAAAKFLAELPWRRRDGDALAG